MRTNAKRFGVLGCVVLCFLIWLCSIYAEDRRYEIRPEITLPEYRTDAARAIDAYERTMDRYMNMTERSLSGVNTDVKAVLMKLDAIDAKLSGLCTRVARIEGALGIKTVSSVPPPQKAAADTTIAKPEKQSQKAPSESLHEL